MSCLFCMSMHLHSSTLQFVAPPAVPIPRQCQLVTDVGRRHLRSADVHKCTVPRTHSQGSAIEVLGSPDHGGGTVCPLNCDSKTFASPTLGGYLRHFCSLRLGALWLLCFNSAGYKHSYLLTYGEKRYNYNDTAGRYRACKRAGYTA